jgi:hypothetical protein
MGKVLADVDMLGALFAAYSVVFPIDACCARIVLVHLSVERLMESRILKSIAQVEDFNRHAIMTLFDFHAKKQ